MCKFDNSSVTIWFLDNDLVESAKMLSNKHLHKSICGCMQVLLAVRFYIIGIRSLKFYKHFFNKDNQHQTLDQFFPCWPMKLKPSFLNFKSKEAKWARCKEHYDYVKRYLDILLLEYEFRYKKPHQVSSFYEWLEIDAPKINVPEAHVKKITLPWKALQKKYRISNIIEGYKAQYAHMMKNNGFTLNDFKNRDIPSVLMLDDNKWMQ